MEDRRGRWHKRAIVNATVVGTILTQRHEKFIFLLPRSGNATQHAGGHN